MAYAGGMLIVSDADRISAPTAVQRLQEYDPTTLAYISVPCRSRRQGYVSGLGGDGLGGAPQDDWYSIDVQAGQALYLQTSTPSDQGGQFPNTASLEISPVRHLR